MARKANQNQNAAATGKPAAEGEATPQPQVETENPTTQANENAPVEDVEVEEELEQPDSRKALTVSLNQPLALGNGTRQTGEQLCTITLEEGVTFEEIRTALHNPGFLAIES